ncbi:hypothetical protein WME94_41755 [Sorangium sp. So ce429]
MSSAEELKEKSILFNDARSRLNMAVRRLAAGSGDLRHRLLRAWVEVLVRLKPELLPEKHRPDFLAVWETFHTPRGVSPPDIIAGMSDEQALDVAREIVDLCDVLNRWVTPPQAAESLNRVREQYEGLFSEDDLKVLDEATKRLKAASKKM